MSGGGELMADMDPHIKRLREINTHEQRERDEEEFGRRHFPTQGEKRLDAVLRTVGFILALIGGLAVLALGEWLLGHQP